MPAVSSRREFLLDAGGGFGGIALACLLAQDGALGDDKAASPSPQPSPKRRGSEGAGLHHPAKVRRVVQLFMNGGVSQMDTFDYKPELAKRHGAEVRLRPQGGGHQRARRR